MAAAPGGTYATDMPERAPPSTRQGILSIEQLETGLRIMDRAGSNLQSFWDDHVVAFRQTVLLAINETTEAMLSSATPPKWRRQMATELDDLVQYLELANRYIARRALIGEPGASEPRPPRSRLH